MEQKDIEKLDDLAAGAGSLEEYLAALENKPCETPASDVAVSSTTTSNESENGTHESAPSVVAPVASEPIDARVEATKNPNYILSGLKNEPLAHPMAPNVTAPAETTAAHDIDQPEYDTKLEIHSHPIVGTYVTETQVKAEKPDWWAETFLGGKDRSAQMASLEEVIDWIHTMDDAIKKIKATQQGARSFIDESLKGMSSKRREEVAKHDRAYRTKTTDETTSERKPRTAKASTVGKTKGMKAADGLALGMGYTYDEIIEKLKSTNLLDADTQAYVDKTYKQ